MLYALTAAGSVSVLYAIASIAWAPAMNWLAAVNLLFSVIAFGVGCLIAQPQRVWVYFICALWIAIPVYIICPLITHNYVGAVFVMGIAVAATYNWWPFVPVAALTLVYSQSRGSIIAAAVVIFFAYVRRFPTLAISVIAMAFLAIEWVQPNFGSFYQRLGIWQDTVEHLTLFGHGLGSFQAEYVSWPIHRNSLSIAQHPYNDYLELLFEFGIGAVPMLIFILLCLEGAGPKLPALAFAVLGLSFFPLSVPIVAQAFWFSLGHLAKSIAYAQGSRKTVLSY